MSKPPTPGDAWLENGRLLVELLACLMPLLLFYDPYCCKTGHSLESKDQVMHVSCVLKRSSTPSPYDCPHRQSSRTACHPNRSLQISCEVEHDLNTKMCHARHTEVCCLERRDRNSSIGPHIPSCRTMKCRKLMFQVLEFRIGSLLLKRLMRCESGLVSTCPSSLDL